VNWAYLLFNLNILQNIHSYIINYIYKLISYVYYKLCKALVSLLTLNTHSHARTHAHLWYSFGRAWKKNLEDVEWYNSCWTQTCPLKRNTFKPVSTDTEALDLNFHLLLAVFTTSRTALRVQYYRWRNNEQLSVYWNMELSYTWVWLLFATAQIHELLKPPGTHKEALQPKAPPVGSGLLLKYVFISLLYTVPYIRTYNVHFLLQAAARFIRVS